MGTHDAATVRRGLVHVVNRRRDDHTFVGGVGALVAGAVLVFVAGPFGLPAGVAVLGAWYLLSVPYALAVGHLVLAVTVPETPTIGNLALVETGFFLVLVDPFLRGDDGSRSAAAALVALLALVGVLVAGLLWFESLPLAALALIVATALLGYVLHRYELFRLGLVEP